MTATAYAEAVWSNEGDCLAYQDKNHFNGGEIVSLAGDGWDPGTYDWEIVGRNSNAVGDEDRVVAYGTLTINGDGTFDYVVTSADGIGDLPATSGDDVPCVCAPPKCDCFCFQAYVVQPDDVPPDDQTNAGYQIDVDGKKNNYSVDPAQNPATAPTITKTVVRETDTNTNGVTDAGDIIRYTLAYEITFSSDTESYSIEDDYDQSLITPAGPFTGDARFGAGADNGDVLTWDGAIVPADGFASGDTVSGSLVYYAEIIGAGPGTINNDAVITSDAGTDSDQASLDFVAATGTIEVTKAWDDTCDSGETYTVRLVGPVTRSLIINSCVYPTPWTVTGLPLGTYTLEETTPAGWYYGTNPADGQITLSTNGQVATATITNSESPQPGISVVKTASDPEPVEGEPGVFEIVFTVTVTNTGGTVLDDIRVQDDLTSAFGPSAAPAPTWTVVSLTSPTVGTNQLNDEDYDGETLIDLVDGNPDLDLAVDASVSFVITVHMTPPVPWVDTYTNTVEACSPWGEPDVCLSDDVDVAPPLPGSIDVEKYLDSVQKTGDREFQVVFTIEVENDGPVTLSNLSLTDYLATVLASAASWSASVATTDPISLNPAFDGGKTVDNDQILDSGVSLEPEEIIAITLTVNVTLPEGTNTLSFANTVQGFGSALAGPAMDSDSANAQMTIYVSIPTLSEWGMIIFSLVMAGTAIWMIRRRRSEI